MYYNTGLSKHQQLTACKELMEYGIIKMKYHGMPKKRYFKFDSSTFEKLQTDFELHSNEAAEEVVLVSESQGSEDVLPRRKFEGFSF